MEHSKFYEEYMKSDQWMKKKAERKEIDGNKCVMCGRSDSDRCKLQVHHITYKNLGHENVYSDLVTLCPGCHLKIHNYYDRIKK